jgi:hypothetical protein
LYGREARAGRLENGVLLKAAEAAGFEVFFTADKNLRYQQNLTGRKIALVVLGQSPWPLVRLHIPEIVEAIIAARKEASSRSQFLFRRRSLSRVPIEVLRHGRTDASRRGIVVPAAWA